MNIIKVKKYTLRNGMSVTIREQFFWHNDIRVAHIGEYYHYNHLEFSGLDIIKEW